MKTDFGPAALAQFENLERPGSARVGHVPPHGVQSIILAGDSTIDAASMGNRRTDAAVSTACAHTEEALGKSKTSVAKSLQRARRAVANWFRPH